VYPAFSKAKDLGQLARGFSMVTKYTAALAPRPRSSSGFSAKAPSAPCSRHLDAATFCFQVFTLLAVLRMTCVHWYDAYVSQGRTRVIPWISAGNALLTTAGAAAGVAWAGIEGAAVLVTLATALTLAFCCGVLVKRLLAVRYLEILRAPLLAAAVAGWAGSSSRASLGCLARMARARRRRGSGRFPAPRGRRSRAVWRGFPGARLARNPLDPPPPASRRDSRVFSVIFGFPRETKLFRGYSRHARFRAARSRRARAAPTAQAGLAGALLGERRAES
jgi:hypothetical protein